MGLILLTWKVEQGPLNLVHFSPLLTTTRDERGFGVTSSEHSLATLFSTAFAPSRLLLYIAFGCIAACRALDLLVHRYPDFVDVVV